MDLAEFSNEFDVLYNNVMSNSAPGIDEYEKSIFLTKAQFEVLKNHFNPKGNKYQEGLDDSPKRQIDFSTLIVSAEPTLYTSLSYIKFDNRSTPYVLPDNLFSIMSETIENTIGGVTRQLNVVPIKYEQYAKFIEKPYKLPCKNQAWRIIQINEDNTKKIAEIIAVNNVLSGYKIRYVKRPTPIILVDLTPQSLSIEGISIATDCIVDPILHSEILQRAVELAKSAYTGDIKSTVELGQRSE